MVLKLALFTIRPSTGQGLAFLSATLDRRIVLFCDPPDHVLPLKLHKLMPPLANGVEGVVQALWNSPVEHRSKAEFILSQ